MGLGSNLGARAANLSGALDLLAEQVTIGQVSSIYETEPVGYSEQPWFLNLVCVGETGLDPFAFLAFAKGIEAELGRVSSFPDAPRIIDIDLLFYGDRKIEADNLTVPHLRIAQRRFVMVPLVEIAASFVHPVSGKQMTELLSELTDSTQVRKWGDVSSIGSAAL